MTKGFTKTALGTAALRCALAVSSVAVTSSAQAAACPSPTCVTSNAIFGSGNDNGSFKITQAGGIELGLRAKVRFPTPLNVFNYDGVSTYTFASGEGSPGRPLWNFEWSINSDYKNGSLPIDTYNYLLEFDINPTSATDFDLSYAFDPIHAPNPGAGGQVLWDHSFGNNSTAQGAGVEATDAANYLFLRQNNNLVQNSWAFNWFAPIDPNIKGAEYAIKLTALDKNSGDEIASTQINVVTTPIPGALFLFASGLGALGYAGRKKMKKADTA